MTGLGRRARELSTPNRRSFLIGAGALTATAKFSLAFPAPARPPLRHIYAYLSVEGLLCRDPRWDNCVYVGIQIEPEQGAWMPTAETWVRDDSTQPWIRYLRDGGVQDFTIKRDDHRDSAYPQNISQGFTVTNARETQTREVLIKFHVYTSHHAIVMGEVQPVRSCNTMGQSLTDKALNGPRNATPKFRLALYAPESSAPKLEVRTSSDQSWRQAVSLMKVTDLRFYKVGFNETPDRWPHVYSIENYHPDQNGLVRISSA